MHGLSPRARKILADARKLGPPAESKAEVRHAVASSVAAGVTVAALEATASSLGVTAAGATASGKGTLALAMVWGSAGIATGVAVTAVTLAVLPTAPPRPLPATSIALGVASAPATGVPEPETSAAPAPAPPATSASVAEPVAFPRRPSVAEELRLLAQARAALRDGDPGRALALADQHDARFGAGTMAEEALAARILALCALGRFEEGRSATVQLERTAPTSPQLDRVRAACAQNP